MPGKVQQSKAAYRRQQKKLKKQDNDTTQEDKQQATETAVDRAPPTTNASNGAPNDGDAEMMDGGDFQVDIPNLSADDPLYAQFKGIFNKFQDAERQAEPESSAPSKGEVYYDDDDGVFDEEQEKEQRGRLSKRKKKEEEKLSIAELKALVEKPELVDWTDVNSPEPKLLIGIKSLKNVVPVPAHWALKREYLSSKRGIEKPAFALPKFIKDTGIQEMRDAALEKQAEASLKQKQRERVQPKMGKLDIEYGTLYDAFFRFQTKPELTRYGEVYYEGKEYETNLKHLRPGDMSDELRDALGMPPTFPPPWLMQLQRLGPPPTYPSLKIPGINAPPPPGCKWGFQPGEWGKPPVDENNRPLFGGDVFGIAQVAYQPDAGEPVEKTLWGELEEPDEDEEMEDDDEEDEDDEDEEGYGEAEEDEVPADTAKTGAQPLHSYGRSDFAAPADFDIRKQVPGREGGPPRQAGTVISEQNVRNTGFFGSERGYDLRAAQQGIPMLGQEENSRKRRAGDVDVAVNVDDLQSGKLSQDELKKRYEDGRRAEQTPWGSNVLKDEDLSQMIAEESSRRLKKDEERRTKR